MEQLHESCRWTTESLDGLKGPGLWVPLRTVALTPKAVPFIPMGV